MNQYVRAQWFRCESCWLGLIIIITSRVRPPEMKQTLGRQVEVREHECKMHVCVGVGSHWLKLLQTILLF